VRQLIQKPKFLIQDLKKLNQAVSALIQPLKSLNQAVKNLIQALAGAVETSPSEGSEFNNKINGLRNHFESGIPPVMLPAKAISRRADPASLYCFGLPSALHGAVL
jgi:hypothetical protein